MLRKIQIKAKRIISLKRFHPWIFSGAINIKPNDLQDGETVQVVAPDGEVLAVGHYQDASIAIRIIAFEDVEPNQDFWNQKIQNAYNTRKAIGIIDDAQTNCYRLIHGEGDQCPGLIIDIYNEVAVVQCHSIGMHQNIEALSQALQVCYGSKLKAIFDKSKSTLPNNYSDAIEEGFLHGTAEAQTVLENGHQFYVDFEAGQKTGFFLDQRVNRQLLSHYVKGKKVLNTFCYSGGFSIYALAAGAAHVDSVDVSKKAIDWTDKNVLLNGSADQHQSFAQDVNSFLKESDDTYDVIVVDPPAYAKSIKKRHKAVQGYKRLNIAAMERIKSGGIMLTFSCSGVVDTELFYNTIVAAAIEAKRSVKVLHRLAQGPDHPVSIFHSESSYLKGLVLEVV